LSEWHKDFLIIRILSLRSGRRSTGTSLQEKFRKDAERRVERNPEEPTPMKGSYIS